MIDRQLLAVAAPTVAKALDLGDGLLGFMLGTAFALAYAAAAIPFGRLADRGRGWPLLIGGIMLWTLASLATGLARSPLELAMARIALGLGQAAFVPAALTLLVNVVDENRRSRRLALFTGASTLGRSMALLSGGLVLSALIGLHLHDGWRWLFVVTAVPNLLLVVALMRLPAPTAIASAPSGERLASPAMLAVFLVAAGAPIIAGQAAAGWMPTLLVRLQGLSPAGAGVLVGSVTLVAAPAGQLLAAWLAQHWPPMRARPLRVIAGGLWVALPALLLVTVADGRVVAAAGIAVANLALGVATFAALLGWQSLWAAGRRGLGNGAFMATVTLLGWGTGPLLTGALSQWAGGDGRALGHALLATGIVAALVASIMAGLRETHIVATPQSLSS